MNLLPKTHEEFSQVEYWNTFFKNRGKHSFEWYGEYPELCEILLKYMKVKDDILVVGCGNSTLSMSLYDVGYRGITNIDISHVAIEQMRDVNKASRPDMIYERMDATEMTYSNDKFSVVLDKGTLDALMPDTKESTIAIVDRYLKETSRVLRNGGRYICISLLQEHILRKLLSYFSSANFMLRVSRCHEAESKAAEEEGSSIPVFAVVATKFTKLPQPIFEMALVNGPAERVSSAEDVLASVSAVQRSALVCNSLRKRSVADVGEVSLDLYQPGNEYPRYTVYVLDEPRVKGPKSYAAFIVPQGRETDWLFGTKEGRQQVLKSAGRERLAIVTLRREHRFESWNAVKSELEGCIRNLAPLGLSGKTSIPFLSLGTDVGVRRTCYEGKSDSSGSFLVEEVERDGQTFRRLIFSCNPYVVQSEARLKEAKSRRGKAKMVVDRTFLACEHHKYMSIGVAMATNCEDGDEEIMVVGLGGGGLCTFLHNRFPKVKITAVEIDGAMLRIATDYFGLTLDDRMKVEIADGIEFLKESACRGRKYKAVLFDVDSKDSTAGMSCPPKEFLRPSVLSSVLASLTEGGLFILNLASREKVGKERVKEDLKFVFKAVISYAIEGEVNEVVVCSASECCEKEWRKRLKSASIRFTRPTLHGKQPSIVEDETFEASSLLERLRIES